MPRVIVQCQNQTIYDQYTEAERELYEAKICYAIASALGIDYHSIEVWWDVLLRQSNADPICLDIVFSVPLWKALIPFWLWRIRRKIMHNIEQRLPIWHDLVRSDYAIWVQPRIGGKYKLVKKPATNQEE